MRSHCFIDTHLIRAVGVDGSRRKSKDFGRVTNDEMEKKGGNESSNQPWRRKATSSSSEHARGVWTTNKNNQHDTHKSSRLDRAPKRSAGRHRAGPGRHPLRARPYKGIALRDPS